MTPISSHVVFNVWQCPWDTCAGSTDLLLCARRGWQWGLTVRSHSVRVGGGAHSGASSVRVGNGAGSGGPQGSDNLTLALGVAVAGARPEGMADAFMGA